jgi:hypothetical protein
VYAGPEEDCPQQFGVKSQSMEQLVHVYNEIPPDQACPHISQQNYQSKFADLIKNKETCEESVLRQGTGNEFYLISRNQGPLVSKVNICNRCEVQKIQDKKEEWFKLADSLWDEAESSNPVLLEILSNQANLSMALMSKADHLNLRQKSGLFELFYGALADCAVSTSLLYPENKIEDTVYACFSKNVKPLEDALASRMDFPQDQIMDFVSSIETSLASSIEFLTEKRNTRQLYSNLGFLPSHMESKVTRLWEGSELVFSADLIKEQSCFSFFEGYQKHPDTNQLQFKVFYKGSTTWCNPK